jgi:hypothetical protein
MSEKKVEKIGSLTLLDK